jgi:hypothetical protein
MVGAAGGCGNGGDGNEPKRPNVDLGGDLSAGLLRAESCDDLLQKIHDDAFTKLDLTVAQYKAWARDPKSGNGGVNGIGGGPVDDGGFPGGGDSGGNATGASPGAPEPSPSPPVGANGGAGGGTGTGGGDDGAGNGDEGSEGSPGSRPPSGSSDTNTQVEGVDEADFVKVVKMGERMFVLHGAQLFALESWPADQTALRGKPLDIEGSPSEMFVTEDAKRAVVFSSVYGYRSKAPYDSCGPDCGGGEYSVNRTKITLADVSGTSPTTLRELYIEGNYLSSRRYGEVVRGVLQGYPRYSNLFYPDFASTDPWGRPYEVEVIDDQLDAWRDRTAAAISATELSDWVPVAQEVKDGDLVDVEPDCGSYFVPHEGLTSYGLTHVLSLDIGEDDGAIGGITIMGAASTVYSNLERLVLAQPDYRWSQANDFGLVTEQQTALHVFAIDGSKTKYEASGWVPLQLPNHNPQFALDEKDGTVRVVTSGRVRDNPKAEYGDEDFWETHTENRLFTAQIQKGELKVIGSTENYGKPNETTQSARFVGDRAYAVTFEQRDPLVVIDVSDAKKPEVLGKIEIPGFSQYMHPLDEDHLITLGQSGSGWGLQLQLFDVSDPSKPKQTDVLDLGEGSSSEASYNHKAFTFYKEEGLLALPLYGNYYTDSRYMFSSHLELFHVDKNKIEALGHVDHAPLFAQQQCGVCDATGCYDYGCSYAPEVRRGHFVSGDDDITYLYSFSYAGVLVNDIENLTEPVATVQFPQPVHGTGPWHGGGDDGGDTGWSNGTGNGDIGSTPGGGPVEGGSSGSSGGVSTSGGSNGNNGETTGG